MSPSTEQETATWVLPLPWTRPPIMDNSRMHWAAKASETRQLRSAAHWLAHKHGIPAGLARARVTLVWEPATRRRRDHSGPYPSLKPLVDGLIDYGLCADDDIEHMETACRVLPSAGKPGRMWLEIRELDLSRETEQSE